jgi:hypothetical protein
MEEFEAAPDRVIASLEVGLVTQSSRSHFRRRVHEALRARTPTFRVATRPGWYRRSFVLPSGRAFGHDPGFRACKAGEQSGGKIRLKKFTPIRAQAVPRMGECNMKLTKE